VVYSREIDGWDALLVPTPAGYRILCNDRMPAARRAFTLCHEVGHTFFAGSQEERYFLRTKERKSYLTPENARLERACDIAAAELLMPEPWFDEAVGRRGLRAAALPELCREFAVSLEAAALRLVETVSRPCAVGFFEFGLSPSARSGPGSARRSASGQSPTMAYRVRRVFPSRGFPFLFPEGKSVPSSSVIYRSSLQLGELEAEETFALGSRQQARLHVCAFPLHKREQVTEPPTVCALFTTA